MVRNWNFYQGNYFLNESAAFLLSGLCVGFSLAPAIKGLKRLKLNNFTKLFIGLSLLVARILNQKSDAN